MNTRIPEWAASFFTNSSNLATSSILSGVRALRRDEQNNLTGYAVSVLREQSLKRNEALRNGAVRLVVALLPETFDLFGKLLSDCSSLLWYEVQFTAFNALDRDDLNQEDQRRVLSLVESYLTNVKSESGYAAWKAGDLLGDEWNSPETVQVLKKLLFSAKHVAGRKAALHGIEHAIKKAMPSEREKLFLPIRKAASADRSAEVRKDASLTLKGVGCHHMSSQEKSAGIAPPR